jgi:hypothetical protein
MFSYGSTGMSDTDVTGEDPTELLSTGEIDVGQIEDLFDLQYSF